ncbi:A24 family peptidase [Rhodopila sp.]|uniref:A24 family peptidase n=1 Tax=Rhodopila sp. TaxID=2480087 RepID=UPI003D1078FD
MTLAPVGLLILMAAFGLAVATLHDIGFRTIPDWLSATLAADGIALRLLDHHLPAGVVCGVAVFILAAFCWRRGWLGGGDVKLLGATAILIPPTLVPGFVLAVSLAGGVLALLYLLLERIVPAPRLRHSASFLRRVLIVECRRIRRRTSLPYATAISAAALLMLAKG